MRRSRKSAWKGVTCSSRPAARTYHRIPCVNASPAFVDALGELALANLGGWIDPAQAALASQASALQHERRAAAAEAAR
ncbi:MAG: hypothetical protein WDN30_06450 [Pararobbsia sp.]